MTSYIEIFAIFIVLLLPFLYETSHVFRYYFKFLVYYGIVSFNSILLIPAMLFRPCDVRNLLWASAFCSPVSTILGLKWELRGKEHLEKDTACVIVCNHQSSLDILGMFDIWPIMNKCTVVAKRELFYAWPFGLAAWLSGLIFIDRGHSQKAHDALNAANRRIKEKNIKLWVFPEGTRRNNGQIYSFKKGAFHMAIDAQIPILPVVFSSFVTFLDDKKRILNAGDVIITTLPPISTIGMTKDDIPKLLDEVHLKMSEVFKKTSREILNRDKIASRRVKTTLMASALSSITASSLNSKPKTAITTAQMKEEIIPHIKFGSNNNSSSRAETPLNGKKDEIFQDSSDKQNSRSLKDAIKAQ